MSADPSRRKLARLPEGAAERLRAAYFDGDVTSVAAMARAHGVSRATVQRFARAQGWPARRRLPRRPKEVAPLVIEPAKPREAAAWPDRGKPGPG